MRHCVCLGWIHRQAPQRIYYFDSHILHSLDHVRVLYYPSYDAAEISGAAAVTLRMAKASRIVNEALALQRAGSTVPVEPSLNANLHDRAMGALVAASKGVALMARTGDEP